MNYEFQLFDKIIQGDLSPNSDKLKNSDDYNIALKQKYGQCYNLTIAIFKRNKSKFVLQSKSKINTLNPLAAKYSNPQKDLFQAMPVNELSSDVLKSLNLNASMIIDVEFMQHTNSTTLVIKEVLNWSDIEFKEAKYYYYNAILNEEVLRIKESIKEQVFVFKSSEKTEHYIHKLQQALINLCFRLMKLLNIKEQNEVYLPSENFSNTDILNLTFISLEELIRFFEKNYLNYIDQNIQIPYRSALVKIYNIDEKLALVKSTLLNSLINPALLQIVYIPFLKLGSIKNDERMTYKELIYLNTYLQAFYDEIKENDNTINEEQVIELVYRINYNSFEIQYYKTSLIKIEVDSIENIPDKIDYLYHRLKIVNQCRSRVNIAFDEGLTSLKDQITMWLEEEIKYLNKKNAISKTESDINLFSETEKIKIDTSLTVAQLALFFKLMSDVGIVTNKTQNDIFKHLAENYQTANASEISIGSIKNKYYNIENVSIELIKQKTIEMLNHLKGY